MWQSIWKWIKRVLFVISMLVSIVASIAMFSDIEGGVYIFLDILTILFAVGSCVLYFIFNESKKWPIVILLIALLVTSGCLAFSSEANIFGISVICSFIGIIISCGVKWLDKAARILMVKKD